MKSFLLTFSLLIGGFLCAQQPFGKNATWHIEYYEEYGYDGYKKIEYQKDTMLFGWVWQKLEVTGLSELKTGPNPNDIQQNTNAIFAPVFLSTRNDSVFYILNGNPQLLYDFNAKVGDSWQVAPIDTSWGCTDTPSVKVVAVGFETINSTSYKYWQIENVKDTILGVYSNSGSYVLPDGRVYEKFGHVSSLSRFSFFNTYLNSCNATQPFFAKNYLRCYSDNDVSLHINTKDCDYWSLIGIEENSYLNNIKIYPNPATNYLHLSGIENESHSWKIFDLSGRILLNGQLENSSNKIDIQSISAGMYILELDGKASSRFLKK